MKFLITLERDEDGIWIAECPSIPGCISQGASRDEAAANIHEAILACLEVRAEQGMPLQNACANPAPPPRSRGKGLTKIL